MTKPIRGGTVPITISYRRVTKRPTLKRERMFVGWKNVLRNIAVKAITFVEEIAYETTKEELDAGESQVVHWAINVEDPWGPSNTARLVAYRTGEDKPPAGASFEVISIEEPPQVDPDAQAVRRPNHAVARQRIREALLREGHYDPEAGPPPEDDGA